MRVHWSAAALLTASPSLALSQAATQQRPTLPAVRNAVYAEVSTLFFTGNLSVNYDRRLSDRLSARVGVGGGYVVCLFLETECGARFSALGMLLYSPSRTEYKFEVGLGASYVGVSDVCPTLCPSFTVGYRHQPADGGFVFRAGANWTYAFGFPFQVSFGHAF